MHNTQIYDYSGQQDKDEKMEKFQSIHLVITKEFCRALPPTI